MLVVPGAQVARRKLNGREARIITIDPEIVANIEVLHEDGSVKEV